MGFFTQYNLTGGLWYLIHKRECQSWVSCVGDFTCVELRHVTQTDNDDLILSTRLCGDGLDKRIMYSMQNSRTYIKFCLLKVNHQFMLVSKV